MKISDRWENVTLLVSAVVLLPIWMAQSKQVSMPGGISSLLQVLQFVLIVVLVTILIRRVRRVVEAFRENKNR